LSAHARGCIQFIEQCLLVDAFEALSNISIYPRDAQRDWNCKARAETVDELPWESAIENDIVTYWNQGKSRCQNFQNLLEQGLN